MLFLWVVYKIARIGIKFVPELWSPLHTSFAVHVFMYLITLLYVLQSSMCWTLGLELHKCYLFSRGCAKDWQLTIIVLLRESTISIFLMVASVAARAPTTGAQQRNLPNTRQLLIISDLSGSSKHVVVPSKSSCEKGSLTIPFWNWKFLLFLEVAIWNHYYLKWRNLIAKIYL